MPEPAKRRSRRVARLQPDPDAVEKVAVFVEDGLPQNKIASLLSLSTSMTSKLVDQATEMGLIEKITRCTLPDDRKDLLRQDAVLTERLHEQLKAFAQQHQVPSVDRVRVFATAAGKIRENPSWDNATWDFGNKAAPWCLDLLLPDQTVGLTYGRTLAALIAGIKELRGAARPVEPPVLVVPLWGEPLGPRAISDSDVFSDPTKLGSTGLVQELHQILNGPERVHRALSLDFVPCFQPADPGYPRTRFQYVMEFASSVSCYHLVFGHRRGLFPRVASPPKPQNTPLDIPPLVEVPQDRRPLADHLDVILTSVGTTEHPGRFLRGEYFMQGDIDRETLKRGALGDLGGVFIPDPSVTVEQTDRDYVESVNGRWTGISLDHYRRCALRAREDGLPGVTVLAVGSLRGEIVRECLRLGLINTLAIDTECAQRLESLTK